MLTILGSADRGAKTCDRVPTAKNWVNRRDFLTIGGMVMGGVTIGTHSVIGAGSVVSKSTKPYTIYAGNPAVEIKARVVRDSDEG